MITNVTAVPQNMSTERRYYGQNICLIMSVQVLYLIGVIFCEIQFIQR